MYWLHHNRVRSDSLFPSLTRDRAIRSDSGESATTGVASVGGGSAVPSTSLTPGADTVGSALSGAPWDKFAEGLTQLNESLAPRLDALRQDVRSMPESLRPPPPAEAPPDYDSMTNGDLATHIISTVGRTIEQAIAKSLEPVMSRVNETQQTQFKSSVESEMKELSSAHKDFGDWKPEMIALAKSHPTLGLSDLYRLAKASAPEKATTLDAKYNPKPPPPTRWGGLTPALGGSNGSAKPLSREEASRSAYAEVASRHPGILAALDTL